MNLPTLDSLSPRRAQLRAKKAQLHVNINDLKSQCAVIRARMQDLRWSRFLRQAVKVDLLTQRMFHHEDTQAVYS